MRILLLLKSLQNYQINFEYHHKIQGFIYSLLRNTTFDSLHDKQGFKFFCFSNIYKSKNSDYHNLIISSPDQNFINILISQLNKISGNHIPIELGGLFELLKIIKIPEKILLFHFLLLQSPIIIRIPVERYEGKFTNTASYKSIYWRSDHPIDLFINSLETNMKKKYEEFTRQNIKGSLFEKFDFKKQVSTKIIVSDSKIPIIGSLWSLTFSRNIPIYFQKFVLDCGLGQRNSLGFGFINPYSSKHI